MNERQNAARQQPPQQQAGRPRIVDPQRESTFDWAQQNIAGMFADAGEAASRLRLAAMKCHLIGGASMCPLRVGHEIMIAVIPIDRETLYQLKQRAKEGEPPPPPKWGIGDSTLHKVADVAGIQWVDDKGRPGIVRLDDGRDRDYAHYSATGRYTAIDGTVRVISNQYDLDLRPSSRKVETLTEGEVKQKRANLVKLAITGAMNRAIRKAFGIPQGMTEAEIAKPFVFARMIFTGRSEDPEVRRLFAHVEAQKQLMAASALYGVPGSVPQLGGGAVGHLTAGQPVHVEPIGHVDVDPEDDPEPESGPAPVAPAAAPPIPPEARSPQPSGGGHVVARENPNEWMPGREKVRVKDATDKDLEYWAKKIQKDFDSGNAAPQYAEGNRRKLAAILYEQQLRRRHGEVPPAGPSDEDRRQAEAIDRGEDAGADRTNDDGGY